MNRYTIILIAFLLPLLTQAKDYKATLFGVKSDGRTLNTRSIQKGIDYISENGGGRLVFEVGRYLTGALQLKSNVTIKLEEGAVLVGSSSIYDYNSATGIKAIISAAGQNNIGISGKGVMEGQGVLLLKDMEDLQSKGFLKDSLVVQPVLIGFRDCKDIAIDSIILINAAAVVQQYDHCSNVSIASITIKSTGSDTGIIFSGNKSVRLADSFVEVAGKPMQWTGAAGELKLEKAIDHKGELLAP